MSSDLGVARPAPRRSRIWVVQIDATPLARARAGILLMLVVLTGSAWVYLLQQRSAMDAQHVMAPTMGLGAFLFLAVWIAMTVASMFPSVYPMVLMFARVNANRRGNGHVWAPTSLFVTGYLLLWSAMGALMYAAAVAAEKLSADWEWLDSFAARAGGLVIVAAGAFQFTKLKERCLTECRSPLPFLTEHWRDGRQGAVLMGMRHGLACAGCCWALMAVLFPVGMMNIAALAGVTALIYAEKILPATGVLVGRAAGILLIGFGLAVLAHPALLPGHASGHGHAMSDMTTRSG